MFAIAVHFPLGQFQANSSDELNAEEWPPHPARLFQGFVSVAESGSDLAALEWLERLEPPSIIADPTARTAPIRRKNFVPTNAKKESRWYHEHPARVASGVRDWRGVAPSHPTIRYVWDGASEDHLEALASLCERLPYLGRSTSPVVAWLERRDELGDIGEHDAWRPSELGSHLISVPRPGYLQGLHRAHEHDQRPWTVARARVRYADPDQAAADASDPSAELAVPFRSREWIVFAVEGRRRVPYQSLLPLTEAFRAAAISALDPDVPAVLHGHPDANGHVPAERVQFLGLPWVDHVHADGRILGFAVSVPREMSDSERATVYRSLVGISRLTDGRIGAVRLTRSLGSMRKWTLDPRRWSSPATSWVTVYPTVFDRYVRHVDEYETIVRGMCERVGLPDPVAVEWSSGPFITGPDRLAKAQRSRRPEDAGRKCLHVRLTFDRPVAGPIVIGHLRHFGLGLMVPERYGRSEGGEGR
jgi:CRISPR-associated protein Csb2